MAEKFIVDLLAASKVTSAAYRNEADLASNFRAGLGNIKGAFWGEPIFITSGKRVVEGIVIQRSPLKVYAIEQTKAIPGPADTSGIGSQTIVTWACHVGISFGKRLNATANPLLKKIWMNGQLIFDSDVAAVAQGFDFKFYDGSETQTADPLLNEGLAPDFPSLAYRGLIYLVIYNFRNTTPAARLSGPNAPVIKVELWDQLAFSMPITGVTTIDGAAFPGTLNPATVTYDPSRNIYYVVGSDNQIHKYDLQTHTEIGRVTIFDTTGGPSDVAQFIFGRDVGFVRAFNGRNFLITGGVSDNTQPVLVIDADSGAIVERFGPRNSSLDPTAGVLYGIDYHSFRAISGGKTINIVLVMSTFFDQYVFTIDDDGQLTQLGVTPHVLPSGPMTDGFAFYGGRFDNAQAVYSTEDNILYRQLVRPNGSLDARVVFKTCEDVITAGFYCPVDNSIVVFINGSPGLIYKLNQNATKIWEFSSADYPGLVAAGQRSWRKESNTLGTTIAFYQQGPGNDIFVLNMLSASLQRFVVSGGPFSTNYVYDAYLNAMISPDAAYGGAYSYPIRDTTTGTIPLADVLTGMAVLQGYELADITVDGSITEVVQGSFLIGLMYLDKGLKDICTLYGISIIQSGDKIKFSRRVLGASFTVDLTIGTGDRAVLSEEDGEFITVRSERQEAAEVPSGVKVGFFDPERNYQYSTESFNHPQTAVQSSILDLYVPLIITTSTVQSLASRLTFDKKEAALSHEFILPQKYLTIEPADVIELQFAEFIDVVKVQSVEYNANWSVLIKSICMRTQTDPVIAVDPAPVDPNVIYAPGTALPLIIDTPLLDYTDDSGRDTLETYLSATQAGRETIASAVITETINGTFISQTILDTQPTYGILRSTLGAWNGNIIDYDASLQFTLVNGDDALFVTVTELAMLNGSNRILVGKQGRWEFIGYINASVSNRIVTLSGLVRGMRGTEWASALHSAGDMVVFYNDAVKASYDDISALNEFINYGAMTPNGFVPEDGQPGFLNKGNSERPWAVANVRADATAGDIVISWDRRTRLNGPLNDLTGTVPLDEDTEAYILEIYNGGGAIVRTVNLTSPTFTYTAVMITADGFGSTPTALRVNIVQISAEVGRGFARDITCDVE